MLCRACEGFGVTNRKKQSTEPVTAKNWFGKGKACKCPAGQEFLNRQAEWSLPIPPGRRA